LGVIASISPLLGLLGTVLGMIQVFTVIMRMGPGHASLLAGGIAQALITTAAGLFVAIPAVVFHRHFIKKVDDFAVGMEKEAMKLVDVLHGQRELDVESAD
jgi:biopolymer transport protein ExbB